MPRLFVAVALALWPGVGAAQVWQAIQAEAARCAKGTPWNFWVHRGRPDPVLVYLQGGGGCWEKSHCDLKDQPTFDPTVDEKDDPATADGVLASAGLTFEALYLAAGRANPKLRLAQIIQDHDQVQLQFLALLRVPAQPLAPLLEANLHDIETAVPTFRRYLIPSEDHTILTRPGFYATVVNGVSLADWITATIETKR